VPTRTTKALYSNSSDYEKKRTSNAKISGMKPSFSTSNIETKPTHRVVQSKVDSAIKYPTYEKLKGSETCETKRQSYNIVQSSRESRRLIEFKLNDDSESINQTKKEESKNRKLIHNEIKSKIYSHKFVNPKADVGKRLYSQTSEQNLEMIKSKYGNSSISQRMKATAPSISIEKSSLHSSKGSRYDGVNQPR